MKLAFSAALTIVLLAIYTYLVVHGINVAQCVADNACSTLEKNDFNDRMASSLALIGGLVSALVIAELSVTRPGQVPVARLLSPELDENWKRLMQIIVGLYLLVWFGTGLSAYIFGYLSMEADVLPPLADLGQAWLGIAVGAAYAYFGIK